MKGLTPFIYIHPHDISINHLYRTQEDYGWQQVKHVSKKYKPVPVLDCRFEDMPVSGYENHFGTLITSESLQYLKLDEALPLMQ